MFPDVDGLRALNDTMGHAAGDRALLAVAAVLDKTLQDASVIARIGGDEFAAIYTGAGASARAELQIALVSELIDHEVLPTGLSAAPSTRRASETAANAMARVDSAMYAKKRRRARAADTTLSTPSARAPKR